MINFRKIASAVASIAMVGSTVALAAAAAWPAPFVQSGASDVAIVYGNSLDLGAVTDVTNSLSTALAGSSTSSNSSAGTTPTGGDFVRLDKTSNNVNLRDSVRTVFGSSVSDDDLPTLLGDVTYRDDENDETKYEQTITLGAANGLVFEFFQDSDYDNNKPSLGINLTNNQLVINYTIDFTTDPDSTVTGGDLVDFENSDIKIMGKNYFISDFDNSTLDITLLDSANAATVKEGETKTVVVGSKTYEVSISFISTSEVVLTINGQNTNSVNEGQSFKLADGSYIGIKDIRSRDVAGVIGEVDFSIGNGKLELRNANSIKLNDETITPIRTEVIRGSATGGKEKIDKINIAWTLDDDAFITPTQDLEMPALGTLKFSMNDLVAGNPEESKIVKDGANSIQLQTVLKDGPVNIPLLFNDATGNFTGIGKDTSNRVASTNLTDLVYNHTKGDRSFVASWNSSTDSESYYLKFDSFTNDNGVNKTTLNKRIGENWVEVCADKKPGDTCTLGSLVLTIQGISPHSDRAVNVTLGDGGNFNMLYTKGGLKMFLPFSSTTSAAVNAINLTGSNGPNTGFNYTLVFMEEDKDDNVATASGQFNITLNDNTDLEVEVTTITSGSRGFSDPDDSNHLLRYVYSDHSTKVERFGTSSDQRWAKITYYPDETYAEVFLTTSGAVSGGSTNLGSVSVMDSALAASGMQGKNLILVGGSCVNSATRSALNLGTSPVCGSAWTTATTVGTGQWLIQTVASPWGPSKVATVVAGYEQGDTVNAATALRTQATVDIATGKKYTGTTATSATLVTA